VAAIFNLNEKKIVRLKRISVDTFAFTLSLSFIRRLHETQFGFKGIDGVYTQQMMFCKNLRKKCVLCWNVVKKVKSSCRDYSELLGRKFKHTHAQVGFTAISYESKFTA
jgi:hypothetical protein